MVPRLMLHDYLRDYAIFLPPLTSLPAGRSFFAGFAARTSVRLSLEGIGLPPLTSLLAGKSFFFVAISSPIGCLCWSNVTCARPNATGLPDLHCGRTESTIVETPHDPRELPQF